MPNEEAEKLFDKAIRCYDRGDIHKAIEYYENAVKVYPHYKKAWYNLGICYDDLKIYQKAIECYETAIKIDPQYKNAIFNMAISYRNLGNFQKAIDCYENVIAIDSDKDALFNLGYAYDYLGNYKKAIEYYEKTLEVDPQYKKAWINMGLDYDLLKNYKKGIECYENAIKIDPNYALAYFDMGIDFKDLKNYQKAIECYENAIKINPKYKEAYYNMGMAYDYLENYESALECYKSVIRIDPQYKKAWNNMGIAYDYLSNYQKAIECYENALKIDPNFELALENLKNLKNKLAGKKEEIGEISKSKEVPVKIKFETAKGRIDIKRGGEIQGGKYIYKIKIENNTESNITDLNFQIISYPKDSINLIGSKVREIFKLDASGFVSPTFEFQPTKDCIKGVIHSIVTYIDHHNNAHTLNIEPHNISLICGLLCPKQIKIDEFNKITQDLLDFEKTGEKINIPYNAKLIFEKLQSILPEQNFKIIVKPESKMLENTFLGEIKGFAEGKFNKKNIGLKITISGTEINSCIGTIEAFAQDEAMLPTLISELSDKMINWHCVQCKGPLKKEDVEILLKNNPIVCEYCGYTISKLF